MDEKVRAFLDEAKEKKLVSMGLIKEVKREYGAYSMKYPKYDPETKQYYREVQVPIDVTDEEFDKILRFSDIEAPKVKEEEVSARGDVKNGAEKTLGTFNSIVLIVWLIIAGACVIAGIFADFDESWILILSGLVMVIPAILSWAALKVYLNISNNLHEINSKLK